MARLKKSKIISLFTELFATRPLVVGAMIVLLVDLLYVNLLFSFPSKDNKASKVGECAISGKIEDIFFDAQGSIMSVTIGDTICYVNKMSARYLEGISIGVTAQAVGDFEIVEGPMNPGEFDRQKYYGSKNIFYTASLSSLKILKSPAFSLKDFFSRLKRRMASLVTKHCRVSGATINTLLLGDKSMLEEYRKDLYKASGVGHFLVISGLHVSLIGSFIYALFRNLGRSCRFSCLAAITILFFYGFLVGFSISVIRSLVMFFIRLFADAIKRVYDMMNAVSIAMITVIILKPLAIMDTAFVYSFGTVYAISVYITYLKSRKRHMGKLSFLLDYLTIPVVLCVFMMPVTLYCSYEYSLASIAMNALLAPLSAPIVLFSAGALFSSVAGIGFMASLFDFLVSALLKAFDIALISCSSTGLFRFSGRPPLWVIVIYYILLTVLLLYREKLSNQSVCLWLMGLLVFLGGTRIFRQQITMLSVGQGDCTVIRTGRYSAVIIDCGSSSQKQVAKYTVVPYLKYSGIRTIQAVFVSHEDSDHMNGVLELCNMAETYTLPGISLESVYLQDIPDELVGENLITLRTTASKRGIPVKYISKGAKLRFDDFYIQCLAPDNDALYKDSNADSMVLMLQRENFSMLFAADISAETEGKIVDELQPKALALKVSHHGSKSASSAKLLRSIGARYALISVGINNRYGHPSEEVLKRLKNYSYKVYRTDRSGAVTISFGRTGTKITQYKR